MLALNIKNLTKTYSNGVQALKGIDLSVPLGEFFALLGPNGAGKSTTIGIATTLIKPTAGQIEICGVDLFKEPGKAKSKLGVVPQEFNFSLFERVWDIVIQQAGYYGVPKEKAAVRAKHYLENLGLWEKRFDQSRMLSGGMKRRLLIARALIHDPEILILDEPTAGVDVGLRRGLWDFLKALNQAGKTIILTTHYLEEAEHLCKGIAIINKGSIIRNTTIKELLKELKREVLILDVDHIDPTRGFEMEINKLYGEGKNIEFVFRDQDSLEISFSTAVSMNDVFDFLTQKGIQIKALRQKANRLEELFLNLTKERSKERI